MGGKESAFGRVLVLTGPEPLLAQRAVEDVRARALREHPDADLHDVEASALDAARLAEMTGGSLLAPAAVAVLRDVGGLPTDLHDPVIALAQHPPSEAAVVLLHDGGQKGKALVSKLKKAKAEVREFPRLRGREVAGFVNDEARRAKVRISAQTAEFLIDAVGHDLSALAAAISQLAADRQGDELSLELARRYFGGKAEVTSFAVADAILSGRTTEALEQLRWALGTGAVPVLVTSALASGLRGLGRLQADRSGMGDNDLGRNIGVPPWKIRNMRQQLRGWDASGLEAAIVHVARADAEVKGAADGPEYALESCLLAIARCRRG